jgi:flagellar protein FlgJ
MASYTTLSPSLSTPQDPAQAYAKVKAAMNNPERAEKSAKEFEQVFLSTLLKPIFETLTMNNEFGGGSAEAVWQGFLVDEYARTLVDSGGLGLADSVMRELLKEQDIGPQQ